MAGPPPERTDPRQHVGAGHGEAEAGILAVIYDPGSAVPPPLLPTPPCGVVWWWVASLPPLWCGVVWLWVASPLPVVWCGSGVGFGGSPPSPPVAWYGLGGSCMFGSAWGVWQTHASRPWGHDLCDSCRFGAIGIGLQWVNCHRDRACQGTWST